ncbi:MAG: proline--tRNA ligase [Spirochaetales bacterium]|nr:proline--tRNA ligase [Spirochaetales bacterium]
MRVSSYLLPTLKEVPSDAVVSSHVLMLRAGMIRKLASGVYNYLPLALRTIRKIEKIIREEMEAAGAQELLMPFVQPAEIWQESGRWDYYGLELLRFQDRKGAGFCLGPTHEEVITHIVRNEISSYKQLPLNLFQIQSKFRDEIRPRFGLMRGREFIMKDGYSFDISKEAAIKSYEIMNQAYHRVFTRCGLSFRAVEAETGAIGGSLSHEFQVLAQNGEDSILSCSCCDYAANIEKAQCLMPDEKSASVELDHFKALEEVLTPGKKSIEDVAEFLRIEKNRLIKTLIFTADSLPVAALIRGDHDLAEAKFKSLLACNELLPADEKVIEQVTGGPVGFSGPLGMKSDIPLWVDFSVRPMMDAVIGANKKDTHLWHVYPSRDFSEKMEYADLRAARKDENCPRCLKGRYEMFQGIEVGQIFYLGTKYSEPMNAFVLDESGKKRPMVMGCYGIGVTRTMAAAIEQSHDDKGIIWPMSIAPFQVILCPVGNDDLVNQAAEELYQELKERKVEVLLDDRNERPGVKFNDADLIGIPIRLVIGKRTLAENRVEVKLRWQSESFFVDREKIGDDLVALIQANHG